MNLNIVNNIPPLVLLDDMPVDFLALSLRKKEINWEDINRRNQQEMIEKGYVDADGNPVEKVRVIQYPVKFIENEDIEDKTEITFTEEQKARYLSILIQQYNKYKANSSH